MKRNMKILAGAILVALSPLGYAQTSTPTDIDAQVTVLDTTAANRGQTQVAGRIAANFTGLTGSESNSLTLVNALRTGSPATLTTTTVTPGVDGAPPTTTTTETTITPATGKMGWGNVKIALALAQAQLKQLGITNPTAEQLNAALNGGDVTVTTGTGATATTTTTTLKGVLQMRADGMGWGQIAQAGGTKLGPVVSQVKMSNKQVAALPREDSSTTTTTTGTTASTKGVRTAEGAAVHGKGSSSKGVTTAAGTSPTASGKGSSKGITTAVGATSSGSASRGLVTADGATAGHAPKGNAYGRGVVTAAGGGAGSVTAATGGKAPSGAGVVTGSGNSAAAVSTAAGSGGGNGKGNAGGNGQGKGPKG
jgi:hypothetical protein